MISRPDKGYRRSGRTVHAGVYPEAWPSSSNSSDNDQSDDTAIGDNSQRRRVTRLSVLSTAVSASKRQPRSSRRKHSANTDPQSGVQPRDANRAACSSSKLMTLSSAQLVTSAPATVLSARLTDTTQIERLLMSPGAWGLPEQPSSWAELINATVERHGPEDWHLTATFSKLYGITCSRQGPRHEGIVNNPSVEINDASSNACSIHHEPTAESNTRTRTSRRRRWEDHEDKNLIYWRRIGKSWPLIYQQFPERTEAAVRSRWYVVRARRQRADR
ncbi:hypothetical protein LTR10_024039 [Elasticomyces elasticus]|uniref:Myb-like domain-containing protein n=1 Tax=Exophiala sideris TaxID=1016849 RepID=A0ABR0IVD8_9EURO|nr:hypothetical protein LTR10_024039 [Elasticomyces elasticus]KAK5021254.1 hypothetical protein LTS07_011169 [Exophiala sideris]KAK5030199.1 hypothetical protein LTR13_008217 [Exophiala sideris]KAK5049143.1 hypothetical protein LTR69_011170 [Exophiala sideris]KAK5176429.1 hypothetical protein LTR44_011051 [Eurotiomycetes sp. CCFEE 6388]